MKTLATLVVFAAVAAVCLGAGAANQASDRSSGGWARVTDTNGTNVDELGLARTADGVLHVAWLRRRGQLADLMHTAIGRGAPNAIVSGWRAVNNPDLVAPATGGLLALFGAVTPETTQSLEVASAGADGTKWNVEAAPGTAQAYASTIGATATRDGTPVSSWATTGGLEVKRGDDANIAIPGTASGAYSPDLATDSSGKVIVAWSSIVKGSVGIFAQAVLPALGQRKLAPGSTVKGQFVIGDQRVGITSRQGAPGAYMAYSSGNPTATRALLWRVGAGKARVVGRSDDVEDVNIAAGPQGRLWVMWHNRSRIYATRTNRAASKAGAVVSLAPPSGTQSIWKLAGEGSLGPLDVFASVSTAHPGAAYWHARLLPGLSLRVKSGKVVSFAVSDAGEPVTGATVNVGGHSLRTNREGRALIDLPAGTLTAVASKLGYTSATARVRSR
jgi:hypothetical protein